MACTAWTCWAGAEHGLHGMDMLDGSRAWPLFRSQANGIVLPEGAAATREALEAACRALGIEMVSEAAILDATGGNPATRLMLEAVRDSSTRRQIGALRPPCSTTRTRRTVYHQ